jgi:hypothetical protein
MSRRSYTVRQRQPDDPRRKIAKRYRAAVYGRMTGSGTFDSELDGRTAVTHWEAVAHLPASAMQRQEAEPSAAVGTSARACGERSNDGRQQADEGNSGSTDLAQLAAASDTFARHSGAATGSRPATGNGADSIQQPAEVTILDLRPATGASGCGTCQFQFLSIQSRTATNVQAGCRWLPMQAQRESTHATAGIVT